MCRASLGWFAHEPEWYDMNSNNFAQSEAQSVSVFIHHLLNDRLDDSSQFDSKGQIPENGNSLSDAVRLFYVYNDFYTLSCPLLTFS